MTQKTTFRSEVNGIQFDSVSGIASHLLASSSKSQFVKPEKGTKGKGGKAKITVPEENDNEQEIG